MYRSFCFPLSYTEQLTEVTHTDAIEETEEPPKQIKVEVIEDEPQVAKKADKQRKIEVEPEEPTNVEPAETVEEPKTAKGSKHPLQIFLIFIFSFSIFQQHQIIDHFIFFKS